MITFVVCVIYVALIYVRPGEIVPAWADLHIAAIALGVAAVSAVGSLITQPRRFANLPNDLCFLGFVLVSILSNPAGGRFAEGYKALLDLLPLVGFYLLIRIAVRTDRQVRWFIGALVLLTLFLAVNGIVQYWTGMGAGGATAVMDGYAEPDGSLMDGSDVQLVRRVRGTGIFGDPNDLAMSLVLVFPFLFSAILSTDAGLTRRLLAAGALATLSYALYLTQSRGGFVGAAVLAAAYAYRRFGRWTALVAATLVAVAIVSAPGRLRDMSASEESAQGRIQAWEAGFEMMKSSPVLGIGMDQFTTQHRRVAHNSFVHVMAETGLVGTVLFVGMFYWFFVGNGPLRNVAGAAVSPLARDLWASCIGAVVCVCFLSRQYEPLLYVPLALGAVRMSVEQVSDQAEPFQRWWDYVLLLCCSAGVVVAAYVAVRMLIV
ncbi:MAG: O-antigen ligase family protein [Acidobacteria bacterium]|nr:O-antigen ligase family protein [Acidobacteriota bacterium]